MFLKHLFLVLFFTAQLPASQGVRNPYGYLPPPTSQGVRNPYQPILPLQYVQNERQLQDAHNFWTKIVEGFMKNRHHLGASHHLGWPDQTQNPYQHLPQIRVKYPSDTSRDPASDPKKIEFNLNVPVQHILKTLAFAKKGQEWFRDFRDDDFSHGGNPVSHQEGAGGPFWSEQKGSPRDMAKKKRTQGGSSPGLNFRFSAPVPGHRDRRTNLQRLDNWAYLLSQAGLVKQSSPEIGLERPILHPGLGLHPCFGPNMNPQMAPAGCPLVTQGQVNPGPQQQIQQPAQLETFQQQMPQQQLPILSQILTAGHNSLSGGNIWKEEMAKQLPRFQLSIGSNHPVSGEQQMQQWKPPVTASEPKPLSGGVYPGLRCFHPEVRNTQGEQNKPCPRLFRGWIH